MTFVPTDPSFKKVFMSLCGVWQSTSRIKAVLRWKDFDQLPPLLSKPTASCWLTDPKAEIALCFPSTCPLVQVSVLISGWRNKVKQLFSARVLLKKVECWYFLMSFWFLIVSDPEKRWCDWKVLPNFSPTLPTNAWLLYCSQSGLGKQKLLVGVIVIFIHFIHLIRTCQKGSKCEILPVGGFNRCTSTVSAESKTVLWWANGAVKINPVFCSFLYSAFRQVNSSDTLLSAS